MRNSVVLRLASVAALAVMASTAVSSPASAFAGLSDKQASHIGDYIRCKTFMLKGDWESFREDPKCGGKQPVIIDNKSMGEGTGDGGASCPIYVPSMFAATIIGDRDDCYPEEPSWPANDP